MPIPEPYLTTKKLIGGRLLEIESRHPGSVRMRTNYSLVPNGVAILKTLGFKKPFFQSPHQFIYDCVLSHHPAIDALLPFTLLSGTDLGDGHIHCWNGCGYYAGWQDLFQLGDFASGNKDKVFLIINIKPFFAEISDLLDPIQEDDKTTT